MTKVAFVMAGDSRLEKIADASESQQDLGPEHCSRRAAS